jgi:hypothetical protein
MCSTMRGLALAARVGPQRFQAARSADFSRAAEDRLSDSIETTAAMAVLSELRRGALTLLGIICQVLLLPCRISVLAFGKGALRLRAKGSNVICCLGVGTRQD